MRDLFGKISKFLNISGRDAKLFIVSLLLAYGIWLIHNLSLNYSEVVRIPVQAQCDIRGHAYRSSNSTVVLARCRARGFGLISLERAERKTPVLVTFNSSDMRSRGDELYYVTGEDMNRYSGQLLGNGAKIEAFLTDTLMFRFPYENHKRVPVQPVYSMSFAPQYINVGELRVVPDSVTIYGEPFHLAGIDRVYTESLGLEGLMSSVHGQAKLDKVKGVRISDESVTYSMTVSRYVEISKTLPVDVDNVPKGHTLIVYPSSATVRFRCSFPLTQDPSESISLHIDYNDFARSLEGQCIPHLEQLPSCVISCSVEPQVFDCVESVR